MPKSMEEINATLEKLLNPDLEHSDRSALLQEIRTDYGTTLAEHETTVEERDKLQKVKDDLIVSNSQLFRQLGSATTPATTVEEEQKTFSETITVSDIEKGFN